MPTLKPDTLAQTLHSWQTFYTLLGGAAATLTGLMFVAATLGVRLINERDDPLVRTFVTPTVIHFTLVLVLSALMTVPNQTPLMLAVQFAVTGLVGTGYSLSHLGRLQDFQRSGDLDGRARLWNMVLPLLSGLVLADGAFSLGRSVPGAFDVAAMGALLLLIVGLHNAWSVTLYLARSTPA